MMTEAPELYAELAKKHNLPIEVIREAVIFFWRTGVKRKMEAIKNQEIYVSKLGSFKIKDYKLKYLIPDLQKYVSAGIGEEEKLLHAQGLLEKLISVKEQVDHIKKEKETFDELNKQNPRNIQEPKADMGRAEE